MQSWPFEIIEAGKEWGFVEEGDVIVLGVEQELPSNMQSVSRRVTALLSLLCSLPGRFYDGSLVRMAQELGCDKKMLSYLGGVPSALSGNVFSRADLFIDTSGWKLLELNIGGSIGGMHMASLPRLAGHSLTYDALAGWAKHTLANLAEAEGRMVFVVPDAEIEALRKPLSVLIDELNRWSSTEVSLASPCEFEFDGNEMRCNGNVVRYLYFRDDQQAFELTEACEPLGALLASGGVSIVMGPEYGVLSSKGALAILWDSCKNNLLDQEEQALVRELVPETLWLTESTLPCVLNEPALWVLKPANGFGGHGVICGAEVGKDTWQTALNEALALGFNQYVIQRYVSAVTSGFSVATPSGEQAHQCGRVVWGPYVFGQHYLGTLIRAQPIEQSAVINYAQGAACGFIGMNHA
ncbi:hypothetical protein [Pseudomonas mosselii]|uniref:hypothetical protein n=1 Tax=Pseudomonas mosselii TaxID=78327 RepID=UPI00078039C6|nr:hypothetical protein [Pseudomonas mosselii]MEA3234652.1 hypothetical protein [Pseudomonas mosselii]UWS65781.1 hypothetical protein N0U38_18615 [Pseudomonas mosselii]